jgi:hypothetical protein
MIQLPKSLALASVLACTAVGAFLFSAANNPVKAEAQRSPSSVPSESAALLPPPVMKSYATPTITCCGNTETTITLQVCAGATSGTTIVGGAPGGFSIQWAKLPPNTTCASFVWPEYTDPTDLDPTEEFCKASFSGHPGCSAYNLPISGCTPCKGPGSVNIGNLFDDECGVELNICGGEELECGSTYVFRAFIHATAGVKRSAFTANLCCSTAACPTTDACMLSQGFWRNKVCNNVAGCVNPPTMPLLPACACSGDNSAVNGLCLLNGACYDANGICTLLNTSFAGPGDANKLGRLAHQVIAVELSYLTEACGKGIPAAGDGGIGDALAAAHAAFANADGAAAAVLTTTLSTFIDDNHILVEPACQ